jgi:hypothetical protein
MPATLRSGPSDVQTLTVTVSAEPRRVMERLADVAQKLQASCDSQRSTDPTQRSPASYVTEVRSDCGSDCVLVFAVVPKSRTAEELQIELCQLLKAEHRVRTLHVKSAPIVVQHAPRAEFDPLLSPQQVMLRAWKERQASYDACPAGETKPPAAQAEVADGHKS